MKLTETAFAEIAKSNGFDNYDIRFMVGEIFENAEKVSLDLIIEKIMNDLQNTLQSETHLKVSGDIGYIIRYLEKYKALIVELENMC